MDPDGQLRNLRDFLLVYNRMTEMCFQRCTSNFNYRNLTMDEEHCVDNCAGKLIRTNHRLMGTYVQLMPAMVQKRMQEMESKAAEVSKAEAAVQGEASALEFPSTVMTDTPPVSTSALGIPATSSPVMEVPSSTADVLTSGLTTATLAPVLETLQVPSAHNDPSEMKTSATDGSAFGETPLIFEQASQAPETAKLPGPSLSINETSLSAVTNKAQTFTSESLEGLAISKSSSSSVPSPKVGVGCVSSAVAAIPVEKLDLKPSNISTTPVPETQYTGQNSQTPS
ncbi:mitochondrial import inner membrane translocase subunit Tim10 B-like [Myxocyprinus asiaticus]|uniref:mitochondrial import inner membrane translocase subunit Tim10 B-like n=1 Tax=Myxocyprinus asiaticus TaxID=70543 RepID=UPI002223B201|nr:mitochondrial import inner membrane translocase subunit Tim10 B-like [Myxocyprinus asiaticus]